MKNRSTLFRDVSRHDIFGSALISFMLKDTPTSDNSPAVAHPADDFNGRGEDHRGDVGGNGGAESWVLDGTHNEMEREFREAAKKERGEIGSVAFEILDQSISYKVA